MTEDRIIDPYLLFQRLLVVSQSRDLSLDEVMAHELSPYTPSLFKGKNQLRLPDKAQLPDALEEHLITQSDGVGLLEPVSKVELYVLDGSSLLHQLQQAEGRTYSSVADDYTSFTVEHCGNATTVYYGYNTGPTTQDNTCQ